MDFRTREGCKMDASFVWQKMAVPESPKTELPAYASTGRIPDARSLGVSLDCVLYRELRIQNTDASPRYKVRPGCVHSQIPESPCRRSDRCEYCAGLAITQS